MAILAAANFGVIEGNSADPATCQVYASCALTPRLTAGQLERST